jgi:hypothetical protein
MFLRRAVWWLCLAACPLWAQTTTTLKLVDGGTVVGRLVTFQDQSIKVALEGGENPVYTNVPWARLTQETLQQLTAIPQAKAYANIFLDPVVEQRVVTKKKMTLTVPPRLDRPQSGSLFASPVMMVLLLLVYAANIYAGFEIGIFRQWPPFLVAAISAFLPIIGPTIFLAMPAKRPPRPEPAYEAEVPVEEVAVAETQEAEPVAEHPVQAAIPQPVVYPRGQFTFNRRFFETKFAGFLKMVPGESERDKVIQIKSARGEYIGQRFSKIEANELFLQIRKGTVSEDVMIPFTEIFEVIIKHKDT